MKRIATVALAMLWLSLLTPSLGTAQSSAGDAIGSKLPPFKISDGRIDSGLKGSRPRANLSPAQLTADINSPGWLAFASGKGIIRVFWRGVSTDCLPCRGLVANYNGVMDDLLFVRYQRRDAHFRSVAYNEQIRKALAGTRNMGKGTEATQANAVGSILEAADAFKNLDRALRQQEQLLAGQAQKLRQQIADCEKQCRGKVTKTSGIKIGGLPALAGIDPKSLPDFKEDLGLPFPWKGPYPSVCARCRSLAERLNILPAWAQHVQLRISSLKRELTLISLKRKVHNATGSSEPFDPKTLNKAEASTKKELAKAEAYLKALTQNFHATLAAYNKCIKTCPPGSKQAALVNPGGDSPGTQTACYEPERTYENVSIGDNDKYGTGAALKDQVSDLVGGKPGLMGGGQTNTFTGGGFGSKRLKSTFSSDRTAKSPVQPADKGPKTVDDPTTGPFTTVKAGDVDMKLRGSFVDDGLMVSTALTEVPGDGSFHAMWIEDNEGRIIRPTRYLPFSMYREWRLKVWWTYDRWVDGQHVEHDEGGWSESWREERGGLMALYGGEEGTKNSIWHSLGFETPVKGVQHLGAVFPLTDADLSGPCPLRLVTHVALPKEDPVVTQTVVNDLSLAADSAGTDSANLAVSIRQTFRF